MALHFRTKPVKGTGTATARRDEADTNLGRPYRLRCSAALAVSPVPGGSRRVIQLVLRAAALLLAIGLGVGTGLALWAGRAATAMLYGLKPYDPMTLGAAITLFAAVALLAS